MTRRTASTIALAALLGSSSLTRSASAQVREHALEKADAALTESFSSIQGLRELSDGRLLVADPLGQALVVVDLSSGRADTIGRVGPGPEEYRQPDGLFPLPGDSTLMVDLGNARLTVLGPDGSFGETAPLARGEPGSGSMLIILPRAVDSRGRVYFQSLGGRMGATLPDSAPVLRWDRQSGAIDTVAMVKLQTLKRSTSGGPGNQNVQIRPMPLSPQDTWAVAPDGRVAAVRASDYHIDWIKPNGQVVRGEPVPYRPVRVRGEDKEQWVTGLGNGVQVMMSIDNGQRQMSMRRGGSLGAQAPGVDDFEWPDVKPAFVASSAWVTPEGLLWVERHVQAGAPRTYDVFGERGQLRARVTLPQGRRVVGFGRGVVYLAWNDEFDLQYLERFRRPAGS